jgi:Kef-type K+ transport system membrane component KefB
VLLTFLAGAELDLAVLRAKWRAQGVIGLVSFAAPFLECANAFLVPRYLLPKVETSSTAGPVPHAVRLGEREG